MPTFTELFKAQPGKPITVDGRELHAAYSVPVVNGDVLTFEFLRSVPRPVQGAIITAKRCFVEVSGAAAQRVELWTNSSPKQVKFKVARAKSSAAIELTNQWLDERFGTSHQIGNAAIEVEQQPEGVLLFRCSDGAGDPDFEDLVFQVTVSK